MLYYSDKFLVGLITEEIELRASEDVASFGAFDADWNERMVVVRAYLIACMENVKAQDDIFNTKFKLYQKEFDMLMQKARTTNSAASSVSPLTIAISRS